uniref:Heavy chain of MAD2-6 IgA Fab n=1 Tax=Homo sapiens TaxID=9606 RepID=UPI001C12CF64|nr:Chain A, Heavy chain of MAD2-6 IgA Fab [Homo sapiens]7K75_C Chain C, Heavy chain of MAD2-6 IgA Fab [Homo sapiens]7K75_I Chain I, Heavy chain of MAD2-6 IgA Fab [Homo sapiens]7K75_M Chain M, Heavy chain of MAD2-6 IgA Fab [Homo sapiens]
QLQLQESGPGLVKPSETLSLTCSVSGESISNSAYYWAWIRQPPGKALEWIATVYYTGRTYHNPSLKSRVAISMDTSKNQFSLKLRSVTAADTAVYYCARTGIVVTTPDWFDPWGPGALVTVSAASPTSPKVFPLSLCSTQPDGNVVIACLVQGFFPQEPLSVTWSESGQGVTARNFPPSQDASGDLYTTSSQLTLPATQCLAGKSVTCHVKHYTNPSQDVTVPCP